VLGGVTGFAVRCFWVEWSWCVWVFACGGSFGRSFAEFYEGLTDPRE